MRPMFDSKGKLNFPMPKSVVVSKPKGEIIINEAYCPNGHNLMSEIKIDNNKGIHLIYTSLDGKQRADMICSPVVGDCTKVILSGAEFQEGEIIKALCPKCNIELDKLFDCECGAPMYLIYLSKDLERQDGQSFCSKIGCTKASRLRFSKDALAEFMRDNCF